MNEKEKQTYSEIKRKPQQYQSDSDQQFAMIKAINELAKHGAVDSGNISEKLQKLAREPRAENHLISMEAEDELILRLRLVRWFCSIVKIDQTKYAISNEMIPPDILVISPTDRPDYIPPASFIEVKDSKYFHNKITNNDLIRRLKFAEACGLPLFFAVRLGSNKFRGWCLVPGIDLLKRKQKKIDINDYSSSWWDEFVGDFSLLVFGNICIKERWSKNDSSSQPICKHPEFGSLQSFEIIHGDKTLDGDFCHHPLMHAIFNALPQSKEEIIELNEKECLVTRHIMQSSTRFSNILFDLISRTQGYGNNASDILSKLSKSNESVGKLWHLLSACSVSAEEQQFFVAVRNHRGTPNFYIVPKHILNKDYIS